VVVTDELPEHLVLVGWNDLAGVTRLRGFPSRLAQSGMKSGLGYASAGQAITPFGEVAPNRWGPMDEVRQVPDPNARLFIPASHGFPPLELFFVNSIAADGNPWDCCPRSFCAAMLRKLQSESGIGLLTAWEHEFTLLGAATPFSPAPGYTLEATQIAAPFLQDVVDALSATGADLVTYDPEFGVGQYEVSCGPALGIAGADRCVIAREALREVARRRGLRASFTPKPAPDVPGNGAHMHFSLRLANGEPASYHPDGPGYLSPAGSAFVAGVFRHLAALTPLAAPAPVSYLRLGTGHWSCGFASIGVQNREAAMRICPPVRGESSSAGATHNIELRLPDGLCNPYLLIGALAAAGLDGIRRGLKLPPLLTKDPATFSAAQRAEYEITALPDSLESALAALRADALLAKTLPATMIETFEAIKHAELAHCAGMSGAEICKTYLELY
jgi:glutamine synthetase